MDDDREDLRDPPPMSPAEWQRVIAKNRRVYPKLAPAEVPAEEVGEVEDEPKPVQKELWDGV